MELKCCSWMTAGEGIPSSRESSIEHETVPILRVYQAERKNNSHGIWQGPKLLLHTSSVGKDIPCKHRYYR